MTLPEAEVKLVANSVFSPGSLFRISIYESNTREAIGDAAVELFSHHQLIETVPYLGNGIYQSNGYRVQERKEYAIRINTPGFGTITASDLVPETVPILNIIHRDSTGINNFNARYATFEITFHDPPSHENYYEIYITARIDTSCLIKLDTIFHDIFLDSISVRELWKRKLAFSVLTLFSSEPVIKAEGFPDQLSALGSEQTFLYFSDKMIDGKETTLKINYFPYYHGDGEIIFYLVPKRFYTVYLRSISKNYYEFRKSQHMYQTYSNRNALWRNAGDFVHIHSNIENGYGLFAGYASSIDSITVINAFLTR